SKRPAPAADSYNAIDHYVADDYNSTTGLPEFKVVAAPWKYFQAYDMNGDGTTAEGEGFNMPNVREMDCFMCHFEGFNNIVNSAAVQMGYLNAAPALSSGMMNMFTQTYVPGTVTITAQDMGPMGTQGVASLSGQFLNKLKPEPPTENCQMCHTPSNMATFQDMFETFLSAAPMEYNPTAPFASALTGKALPSYDIAAAFYPEGSTSAEVFMDFTTQSWVYGDGSSAAGPFGIFPIALDSSWSMLDESGYPITTAAGGGKDAMTGPLYYEGRGTATTPADQNAMKKSTIPFPKADWFKRGDLWEPELEVHYSMGCGGCHYNGNSGNTDLNQCDPGRGQVRMGGIESKGNGEYTDATLDTRNTVKTCVGCHVTGKSHNGSDIDTFGAPNPGAAHADAGLLANVTTGVKLNETTGAEETFTGNHMDVIDCSTCHVYKPTMAVRALDCTSGKRFPTLIGIDESKGMMSMFTDPMQADSLTDEQAVGAVNTNFGNMGVNQMGIDMFMDMTQYGVPTVFGMPTPDSMGMGNIDYMTAMTTDMGGGVTMMGIMMGHYGFTDSNDLMAALGAQFPGLGEGATQGDAARAMLKAQLQEWKPIYGWHANAPKKTHDGEVNTEWRRKIIPINFITAQMWDDAANAAVDANGDDGEENGMTVLWDPWISRDMKAGMNFNDTGFATVPIGFGGGAYQSAYNADGTFTGAFDYVGIYGGNALMTTPEQINAYKAYREGIKDSPGLNGRSWAGTKLVFMGGNPFQVTHNVSAVRNGKTLGRKVGETYGCADCHSAGSNFFSGAYDMTGTGVPASNEYDYDASGFTFGLDLATATASNMMQRPVVDYEVVADSADLLTGSEAKWKFAGLDHDATPRAGGYVDDVEFIEHGCWDGSEFTVQGTTSTGGVFCTTADYARTTDLDRSAFLYPDLHHDHDALVARIAELESITAAAEGIGETPEISEPMTVNGATTTGGTVAIEVAANAAVTLGVEDDAATGTPSYSYYNINDESVTELAGNSVTFTTPGTYRVVVTTTTVEGKVAQSYQYVTVKAPAAGVDSMEAVATGQDVVLTLTVGDFPAGTANIAVSWGDGGALSFVDPLTLAEVTADNTIDYTYTGTAVGSEVKVRFSNSDNETLGIWHDVVK
ncbi:MAG: hypothetical protein C0618_07910, partial [Desulfuromonas sp.]